MSNLMIVFFVFSQILNVPMGLYISFFDFLKSFLQLGLDVMQDVYFECP